MEQSRRDFLKKSAIVGGAAWVAPSIITVSSASAASPACNCPGCTATGTGAALFPGEALPLGQFTSASGSPCSAGCALSLPTVVSAACGKADSSSCSASAFFAGAGPITIPGFGTLTATLISTCVCCGVGGTIFSNVSFTPTNGTAQVLSPNCDGAPVSIAGAPGQPPLLEIITNEQTCSGGVLTVNGLRVSLSGSDLLILAQSKAGASACTAICQACTPGTTATPPCTAPQSGATVPTCTPTASSC